MKIGILGLGSIGRRHADNFKALGCDVRYYDSCAGSGGLFPYMNRDELIELSDAIVIATPTAQHWQDISDCNAAGRFMFVEKPLTDGKTIYSVPPHWVKMVGYNLRFHDCVQWICEHGITNLIGEPQWAKFMVWQPTHKPAYLADGVLFNYSHEIDLALHLLGPATVSHVEKNTPTTAAFVLWHDQLRCGSMISMKCSQELEKKTRNFQIQGRDGALWVDLLARIVVVYHNIGGFESYQAKDSFDKNYIAEARAFLDRLTGPVTIRDKIGDGCTFDEAMEVLKICNTVKGRRGNASGGQAKMEGAA